jgi:hypothetical protein
MNHTDTPFLLHIYLCKAYIIFSRNTRYLIFVTEEDIVTNYEHTQEYFASVILTFVSLDLTDVKQRGDVNVLSERSYGARKSKKKVIEK